MSADPCPLSRCSALLYEERSRLSWFASQLAGAVDVHVLAAGADSEVSDALAVALLRRHLARPAVS